MCSIKTTFRKTLPILFFGINLVSATAQTTYRVVASLTQDSQPGQLTEVWPGTFYSTATSSVFSVTKEGTITTLATFVTPWNLFDNDRFYNVSGAQYNATVVFSFAKKPNSMKTYGSQALVANLSQNLPDGYIVGTAAGSGNTRYLVKADLSGNVTSFYQFPQSTWSSWGPYSAIYGFDGNYYGVVLFPPGQPYIYQVTPAGVGTTLFTLPNGGGFLPFVLASDGNFYGGTSQGGSKGHGVIYQLTMAGKYTEIYSFTNGANIYPNVLIQASDGNLYGTTAGGTIAATLFKLTTSGQYTLLHTFSAGECPCFLTQGSDGVVYGAAFAGGSAGLGFIWALDGGLPKPAPQALQFTPTQGPAGTKVRIWGYNLFHATVQFNGVAATAAHNSGSDYVFASVPAGATSGAITVTTPGGTSTTATSFTVQ